MVMRDDLQDFFFACFVPERRQVATGSMVQGLGAAGMHVRTHGAGPLDVLYQGRTYAPISSRENTPVPDIR